MSYIQSLCHVWDPVHKYMLCDLSHHVTRPYDVCVAPKGVIVVLGGRDVCNSSEGVGLGKSRGRKGSRGEVYSNIPLKTAGSSKDRGLACLTLLSPAGTSLCRLSPLPGDAREKTVHVSCPSDTCLLISDKAQKTVTLFAFTMPPFSAQQGNPTLRVSRCQRRG